MRLPCMCSPVPSHQIFFASSWHDGVDDWGALPFLGSTAVYLSFGPSLPELCDSEVVIEFQELFLDCLEIGSCKAVM